MRKLIRVILAILVMVIFLVFVVYQIAISNNLLLIIMSVFLFIGFVVLFFKNIKNFKSLKNSETDTNNALD